jgi:amidase
LARSVTDLALMLDATVGSDPRDAVTAGADAHVPKSYAAGLQPGALKGARIGVLRSLFMAMPADVEGQAVYDKTLAAMRAAGAEIVDVAIPGLNDLMADYSTGTFEFAADLQRYLAQHPGAPVTSLADIVDRGLHHDQLDTRLRGSIGKPDRTSPGYQVVLARRTVVRAATDGLFERERLDAIIYPTALGRPPVIGGENIASNCPLSVVTGLPALAMPAGFTPRGLPVGMELLGRAFAEPKLLGLAYGWEQLARPRQAPFSTPPLVAGKPPGAEQAVAQISGTGSSRATIRLTYDPTTARLHMAATARGAGRDAPLAIALHRSHEATKPGPILLPLLLRSQQQGSGDLVLDGLARADLRAGRLYVVLYTQASPLGAGQARLTFKP